jgi:ABC-2 type transport system ATP-binding protein
MTKDNPSENIITVNNITKRYRDLTAVNSISFGVKKGDIFAFLGPNGAGKTTTIKILITLLAPTSGGASIDGHDVVRDPGEVRRIIGYVPQLISVDGSLSAYENLMVMAKLYDIPFRECAGRVKETLAFLRLEKSADTLVREFSGGMIRKLEIGQAMLHHPRVLFLDEPTSGLDPVAKQNIWDHLLELRDKFGTTIFFSTHNMEEAEQVCDRVAIMNAGNIAVIGTVSELKERTGKKDATLEDAFIFYTGDSMRDAGNFREIRRSRRNQQRLG